VNYGGDYDTGNREILRQEYLAAQSLRALVRSMMSLFGPWHASRKMAMAGRARTATLFAKRCQSWRKRLTKGLNHRSLSSMINFKKFSNGHAGLAVKSRRLPKKSPI